MKFIRILFLLFVFQQSLIAQEFRHLNYTTSNGLPSSEVYSLLEDSKGYMWFATDHGVCRYNGKTFTTYTVADSLPDNSVFRMCEDPQGRIWFASQSNELCYWDKGAIHQTPASAALHKQLPVGSVIKELYIDSSNTIWVNTEHSCFYSEAKNNYSIFHQLLPSIQGIHFYLISTQKNKIQFCNGSFETKIRAGENKYILNIRHLYRDKPDHYQDYKIMIQTPAQIIVNGLASNGDLLIGNDSTLEVLSNGVVTQKRLDKKIIKIVTDPKNGVWICYYKKGVDYFKDGDFSKPPVSLLTTYSVDDICMDHEGGVWAATLENGVFYMPSTSVFVYPGVANLNDHIIYLNAVNDTLLISTFGQHSFQEVNQQVRPSDWINKLSGTAGNLYSVLQLKDTFYYGFLHQMLRFNARGQAIPFPNDPLINRYFKTAKMSFATQDGNIWIVNISGLRKANMKTLTATPYQTPYICSSAIPVGNDILVATKRGLYLFKDEKFASLAPINPLLNSPIIDLKMDIDSTIWIATVGNGVLRLKGKQLTRINQKDGLISNICTALALDNDRNIWVGTNRGLSCILRNGIENDKLKIKNVTEQTGLNSNDITKLYAFKDKLWVGTMSGVSSIVIADVLKPIAPSLAHIDSIKVNNKPIAGRTLFPYHENNLKFILNALTFKNNGNHTYRYRLIGLDTTWQQTSTDEILISNLAPGNYIFQAQAANADNTWSLKSCSYEFTIEKPFWLTWWFILLEIIALIIVVYLIVLWRTNIIQKKENEKLRINKLLAEYQMKALTAQMNPHFIFNAINSIQNFIIQNHATLAYDYLVKFSKLIRLVLNNSKDNEISLKQELDTLGLYIELEQLRFEKSFTYNLNVEPQIDQEALMIPALLLQPYIENAIWHGLMPLKTRLGIISLTIIQQNDCLKVTISDNGVGRKASDQIKKKIVNKTHQSVGMELTGKRIELFGHDTKFSLQIIDNYTNEGEPSGTSVEIILPMVELY
jgi:ligand-binding sensor domain-containing protein